MDIHELFMDYFMYYIPFASSQLLMAGKFKSN